MLCCIRSVCGHAEETISSATYGRLQECHRHCEAGFVRPGVASIHSSLIGGANDLTCHGMPAVQSRSHPCAGSWKRLSLVHVQGQSRRQGHANLMEAQDLTDSVGSVGLTNPCAGSCILGRCLSCIHNKFLCACREILQRAIYCVQNPFGELFSKSQRKPEFDFR
jgi:hypothetical protein